MHDGAHTARRLIVEYLLNRFFDFRREVNLQCFQVRENMLRLGCARNDAINMMMFQRSCQRQRRWFDFDLGRQLADLAGTL